MKSRNAYLLLLATLFALPAFGLHHRTVAPLWDHLNEVNVQWANQGLDPADFAGELAFETDVERIQLHLFLVAHHLRSARTDGLSTDQCANRKRLIRVLYRYAMEGRFPVNLQHALRTPTFIDDAGTACAVGHLLVEDGQQAFADKVSGEMNFAYIRDMPYAALPAWAGENGFSVPELEWIQPGYAYVGTWAQLPAGEPNAQVSFIWTDEANGRLIVAGDFTDFGGVACNGIVSIDSLGVTALGTSPGGLIHTAAWHNGQLYLGGSFASGRNLASWDGNNWTTEQVHAGEIHSLKVYNGYLYAGGNLFSVAHPTISNMVVWRFGEWESVGEGFDGTVHSLEIHNGDLYAGGAFRMSGQDSIAYTARLNQSAWEEVGGGFDNIVRALKSDGTDLYAAGDLVDLSQWLETMGFARLNGSTWQDQINPGNSTLAALVAYPYLSGIHFHNSRTYLTGDFMCSNGFYWGFDLGEVDGNGYVNPLFSNGDVYSSAIYNDQLVIGSNFQRTFPNTVNYIAGHDVVLSRNFARENEIELYPNPSTTHASLRLPEDFALLDSKLTVHDLQGRVVQVDYDVNGSEVVLHRGALASGAYMVNIRNAAQQLVAKRWVVE